MNKFFTFLLSFILVVSVKAQNTVQAPTSQAYGVVDTADLRMTTCDFEKDANAEVLFDVAVVDCDYSGIVMERHKRIKILNEKGKDEANIRMEFYGIRGNEEISNIAAETINLNNKTIEFTSVDKKLIYTVIIDRERKAIVFTFPNVRAGSVIEFKYRWTTPYVYRYPNWVFQSSIPTRYSEFNASFDHRILFQLEKRVYQPMFIDTSMKLDYDRDNKYIWALSNVKSLKEEPFTDYPEDYLQCILVKTYHAKRTWESVGTDMLNDEDFGDQLKKSLKGADTIIARAKTLKTNKDKVAYIFNAVKKEMKWNKVDNWYTDDGVKKAWDKKTGNSTEINLVLYNLLKAVKINTLLMALSTRENGKIDNLYPGTSNFNKTVLCYAIDSTNYYVLDASNRYNTYNNIPLDLIGLTVFSINPDNNRFAMFPLKNGATKEIILINGSISADGKLEGTRQVSGSTYSREKYLRSYNDLGENKYIEKIEEKTRGLKITSLKLDNVENDMLPLVQTFDFKYNMTEPDGDYLYVNPNLLTGYEVNPFLSETRISNINLGCLYTYSINESLKIPPGYKVDVLPGLIILSMPDKSIVFKRLAAEEYGSLSLHYTISYNRSVFSKKEYAAVHDFYKKMHEMLNEQIVLKKGT